MKKETKQRYADLKKEYEAYKKHPLKLNLKRGVPGKDQLKLSEPLLTSLNDNDSFISEDGTDIRNYGNLTGLSEAKTLFAEMLDVTRDEVIVGGNSSLQLMYIVLSSYILQEKNTDRGENEKRKLLCPSPGYDRHFALAEYLGFELIPIDLLEDGPDMKNVKKLAAADKSIKGIWCVPTYSNPTGVTYSAEVVQELAEMETAAEDFLILWDNAYVVHHLTSDHEVVDNILEACKQADHPNRPWLFCSTSKITFPGAGVAAVASSKENRDWLSEQLSYQTIGFDKMNQMRHVKFLKDKQHVLKHMEKHAAILKPKFDLIVKKLERHFGDDSDIQWTEPKGGYFVHITTPDGCAEKTVRALDNIGVQLTKANAAYPYGKNPKDNSIRLAPTPVSLDELNQAMDRICLCLEMIALEKRYTDQKQR